MLIIGTKITFKLNFSFDLGESKLPNALLVVERNIWFHVKLQWTRWVTVLLVWQFIDLLEFRLLCMQSIYIQVLATDRRNDHKVVITFWQIKVLTVLWKATRNDLHNEAVNPTSSIFFTKILTSDSIYRLLAGTITKRCFLFQFWTYTLESAANCYLVNERQSKKHVNITLVLLVRFNCVTLTFFSFPSVFLYFGFLLTCLDINSAYR